MTPYLETERLVLRRVHLSDVDNLMVLNADEGVMTFIDWRPPTRDQVEAEVERVISSYDRYRGHGTYIAEDREGRFVGWFALTVGADGPTVPELGYRLRRSTWGQGLATEGGRALIDRAFTELTAERVIAETMAVNSASRRVMEKCGMRYVRTFHAHFDDPLAGTEQGEVEYEITRQDWQATQMVR